MQSSRIHRQRLWWRFVSRAALAATVVGLAISGVMAIYGDWERSAGVALFTWLIFCLGVICVRSQWSILTEPYGLFGGKEPRPFPPEFRRPPDFFDARCNYWMGELGLGMQFPNGMQRGNAFFPMAYTGPCVFIPREQILIVYRDGWLEYRLDHRSPEIESPIFVPKNIGLQLERLFPERTPHGGKSLQTLPMQKPVKLG
jgi:hypothetical protein